MLYIIEISGIRPIIMHSAQGLDPKLAANIEKADITRKRGSNRTASDDARLAEIECELSLWLDWEGRPTIPATALRSCIETGARKLKQGPQVREGLIVNEVLSFEYDRERYGETRADLVKSSQFSAAVVVQRARLSGPGPSSTCPGAVGLPWTVTTSWWTASSSRRGWILRVGASAWATGALRSPATSAGSSWRRLRRATR